MEIIDGGIKAQCQLVLRHINRIIETMNLNGKLRDVLQVCSELLDFVTIFSVYFLFVCFF